MNNLQPKFPNHFNRSRQHTTATYNAGNAQYLLRESLHFTPQYSCSWLWFRLNRQFFKRLEWISDGWHQQSSIICHRWRTRLGFATFVKQNGGNDGERERRSTAIKYPDDDFERTTSNSEDKYGNIWKKGKGKGTHQAFHLQLSLRLQINVSFQNLIISINRWHTLTVGSF